MSDKEFNNEFRFSLYQGDVLLGEKVFDADQFNPFTRYAINIRDVLPKAITKLQKTLSRRSYDVELNGINLFQYNQQLINSYPKEWRADMRYKPEIVVQQIENKTIKGVECKIGFYINENTIVERIFYVDGFNPVARWSVDLINVVVEIADMISESIKRDDIENMWDDYDLINERGLSINQIRELSPGKRRELLRRIRNN
jgi:hypothetical protein